MALKKAKGGSTKASPFSLMCARTWDCSWVAVLQEEAVVVAVHVQRADSDARAKPAGYSFT